MVLSQANLKTISFLKILLLCFTPLIPFLCFELINNLKNDNDDDEFDGEINILALQSEKIFTIINKLIHQKRFVKQIGPKILLVLKEINDCSTLRILYITYSLVFKNCNRK